MRETISRWVITRRGAAVLMLVLGLLQTHNHAFAQSDSLEFERCQIRLKSIIKDAECATLERAENPRKPDGKTISLFVAKFPAYKPRKEADAFMVIEGGPGGSSVDLFLQMGSVFDEIRQERDVLVVDQRGTGRSNRLSCKEPDSDLDTLWHNTDKLRLYMQDCAESLDADLSAYTTSVAVQDLEAVRIAAGYPQLTIYGFSYGSRVAQHYLRRFPDAVRAMIIDGVVPVELILTGAEVAKRSHDAFTGMLTRCEESVECKQRFGNLQQKFEQLRSRLRQQPQPVRLQHHNSGEWVEDLIGEDDLLTAVRLMPYSTDQLSLLPYFIDQAHAENYAPLLAWSSLLGESLYQGIAVGMSNSVSCSEDAPNLTEDDLLGVESTYMGMKMLENASLACEYWPAGIVDDDFHAVFDSDKPVLILSGETDPITPPANGDKADQMFSNSMHIEVPAHGHGVVSKGCLPQLTAEFVEHADLEKLDAGCATREIATPFFIGTTGPTP